MDVRHISDDFYPRPLSEEKSIVSKKRRRNNTIPTIIASNTVTNITRRKVRKVARRLRLDIRRASFSSSGVCGVAIVLHRHRVILFQPPHPRHIIYRVLTRILPHRILRMEEESSRQIHAGTISFVSDILAPRDACFFSRSRSVGAKPLLDRISQA